MIEKRPGLDIFSHTLLALGALTILFPLYIAFVAATLDGDAVYQVPMTLVPGSHLWENISRIWSHGVNGSGPAFGIMMLNSLVMALSITIGKIAVSMLSAFALVWFRFPLRGLFLDDLRHADAPGGGSNLPHSASHRGSQHAG